MQKGCLSLEQQHFLTRFHILEINKGSALKFREHGLQVIDLYMSLQSLISQEERGQNTLDSRGQQADD